MIRETVTEQKNLEYHLLKSFWPIYIGQIILGSIRVHIKNDIVSVITSWQILYFAICFTFVTYSYTYYMRFYQREFYPKNFILYLSCIFGNTMQYAVYFVTIFVNLFAHREKNVKLFVMIQKIDRTLQLDQYKYYTIFAYRLNLFLMTLNAVGFLSGFSANAFALLDKPVHGFFFGLGLLTIYLDTFLGISMIYFLAVRMRHFNRIVKNHINLYKGKVKKGKLRNLLVIPNVQKAHAMLNHHKWLKALQDILGCYKLINELYRFSILILSLTILIWTFIAIGGIVVGVRSGLYPLSANIAIGMWAGYCYFQLTMAVVVNDWFIYEVSYMKLLCIRLISCNYDGPYQKTASEIIRMIHYEKPVFQVYGIFVLDRRLPIELIGVIASNILVTIQFVI